MKTNFKLLGITAVILSSLAFTLKNQNSIPNRECEYSFYVKCPGSNQFTETVKAKDMAEAKAKATNRYPNCKVTTKDANNCN
jgi:hypothetical protein